MYVPKRNGWSVLILLLAFACQVEAADTAGMWAIKELQIANKVQLSLQVIQDDRSSFNSSSAFDIAQLRGLSASQVASPVGTMARFELVREAGTFEYEGYVGAGSGAGTFLFQADPAFIQHMRALGFLDINENRLFSMALHDVGPRFANEIRATGIRVSTAAQLIAMRIHGVTVEFIRGIQEASYKPEVEELIRMRIHGVTPDYIRNMQSRWKNITLDQLVRMKIHGIE